MPDHPKLNENRPISVLLIEDDDRYALFVRELLATEKSFYLFQVSVAQKMEEAKPILQSDPPDVILLDISMCANYGLKVFSWLRKEFPGIPVVVLMQLVDESRALQAVKEGAKDFLLKDYTHGPKLPQTIVSVLQKKAAEDAQREGEERFRVMIENSSDVITVLNKDGVVDYESPSLERIFGYEPNELIGKRIFEYVHPEDREKVLKVFQECIKEVGSVRSVRFRFAHKNGSWIFVESISKTVAAKRGGEPFCVVNSRDVTERIRMESELRSLSFTDELTGTHNRKTFMMLVDHQLKVARREKKDNVYMLYADVDNLKEVNARLGEEMGDQLLVDAAQVLKTVFRSVDIISRIDGDEFAVFLPGTKGRDDAMTILKRLSDAVQEWQDKVSRPYKLSISAGIVQYNPEHPKEAEVLLSEADKALSAEKLKKKTISSS
ncbi:MAG: diguanylate cyclase [Candidatus Omnitrophica bacterium]|nr:diguanylate cyclase [Candidatus Omnitrophota bacterium]